MQNFATTKMIFQKTQKISPSLTKSLKTRINTGDSSHERFPKSLTNLS